MIERHQFEVLLSKATEQLTQDLKKSTEFHSSKYFEQQVRVVLHEILKDMGILVDMSPPAQEFPDIIIGNFGVEVKYSDKNTWRSIANSIFEGSRKQGVDHVYLLFGKVGGEPEVRWGRYEDSIMHVRTSHVPRFEVEIDAKEPLFKKLNISYNDFRVLSPEEKMPYIRDYAKRRLKSGERLWWIDDQPDARSLPLEVRLYTKLTQNEKRRYRAESAVLCPQILRSSRVKGKYDDITMFLLTYYGILCNQARDLFTAGSVAMRASDERGECMFFVLLKILKMKCMRRSIV
ncbi:TPA: restriction endonuclease [Escherichia coli]